MRGVTRAGWMVAVGVVCLAGCSNVPRAEVEHESSPQTEAGAPQTTPKSPSTQRTAEYFDGTLKVALVDSTLWEDEEGVFSLWVHRIEVRTASGVDTIPGVVTDELPVAMDRERLTGLMIEGGAPVAGFIFHLGSPSVERIELPPNFEFYPAYALAPDGRHIAYVASHRVGNEIRHQATVRRWPTAELVAEGAFDAPYGSDVVYDRVEWIDPERFKIALRLDHFGIGIAGDYRTEVFQINFGSVSAGIEKTDTTVVRPAGWRAQSAPFDPAWPAEAGGFGPVRVGMSVKALQQALGEAVSVPEPVDGCDYVFPRGWPEGIGVMIVDGHVARVEVSRREIGTAAGAKVGTGEQEIRDLYPGQVELRPHKYTDGHYLIVTPRDQHGARYRIIFETDGGVVENFRAGALPAVEWVEGCA